MRVTDLRGWCTVALLASVSVAAAGREVPLIEAAKKGDAKTLRALVQNGDVNAAEADGTTALHWAAHRENVEAVDLLLRAGANAKVANRYGVTPLSVAATGGNAAIIERLIAAGADPNATMPGGETPLMTAARTGRPDAIRVLIVHGADVNAREAIRGQTALMWAAAEGNAAAIRALIEGGADVNARATGLVAKGAPPQSGGAARQGQADTGTNRYVNAASRRIDRLSPLLFAARKGHIEAVRVLLELGAEINDRAPDGSGPVAIAIANAHYELASVLLDKGADPNLATDGWTTLHQLVRTRTPSRGRLLPVVGYDAQPGLDLAAKLIARGVDVNARMTKDVDDGYRLSFDRKGATPFFLAAKGLDVKMMQLLLAHGADPKLTVADGTTALMGAAGLGSGAPGEDGTDEDALAAVKLCLEVCNNDVNAVTKDGWTALHGAASRGVNAIVQLLIDRGALLNPKTKQGITPIQIANAWSPDPTHVYRQPQTVALLREVMTSRAIVFDEPVNPLLPPSRAGARQQ
jgi:uncharacterized protein